MLMFANSILSLFSISIRKTENKKKKCIYPRCAAGTSYHLKTKQPTSTFQYQPPGCREMYTRALQRALNPYVCLLSTPQFLIPPIYQYLIYLIFFSVSFFCQFFRYPFLKKTEKIRHTVKLKLKKQKKKQKKRNCCTVIRARRRRSRFLNLSDLNCSDLSALSDLI